MTTSKAPSSHGTIDCLAKADINQWGGADPSCFNITIGDISILIDNFSVTGHQSMALPDVCQRLYEREEL